MAKRFVPKSGADEQSLMDAAQPEAPPPPKFPVSTLDHVIGQAQAKKVLQGAMASGRVHHAWIFHGPSGVGKFSAAVAFAASILDPHLSPDLSGALTPDPDGQVQQLVRRGAHPDLHIVTKELAAISRNENVRKGKQITLAKDVIEEFLLEPAAKSRSLQTGQSLAAKVFIVDDADMMRSDVQNILLKTLEEPPPGTVIILVTSAEERLLPTIRSRCQRVPFVPLDDKDLMLWLSRRGTQQGGQGLGAVAPDVRQWLVGFACGSPGAAEVALENDLMSWENALRKPIDEAISGRFPMGLAGDMAKLIDERAAEVVRKNADASKDAANKAWARRMLAFVAENLRHRLRKQTAGRTNDEIDGDPVAQRLLAGIDAVAAAEWHLASNVNMALMLENLVAQMSSEPTSV